MRLDGASKPHRGAPAAGSSSPGARCDRRASASPFMQRCQRSALLNINNNNNYSNSNNNNNNYSIVEEKQTEQELDPPREDVRARPARTVVASAHHNNNNNTNNNNNNDYSEVNMAANTAAAVGAAPAPARPAAGKRRAVARNAMSILLMGMTLMMKPVMIMLMRAQQSLGAKRQQSSKRQRRAVADDAGGGARLLPLLLAAAFAVLLPSPVRGDDGDNFFAVNTYNMAPETTTPEFDYASRGQKKFGDKCENTLECGFPGSICDTKKRYCQCTEDLPVTNHIDKCGKEAAVNESCFFNEQCETKYFQTECRDGRCACRFEMSPIWAKDGTVECKGRQDKRGPGTYIDPAMIGVLVGMALMFIIICVVLRLFSQARWRENRTIFNTPNPRLMNVSLLRDSKLLHGQERRGSRMSVRAPSRQPSMASLRPHSPNPSLGKAGSGEGSHGSNASATSVRSARSNSVAPGHVVANSHGHHDTKGSAHTRDHHHPHPQQQLQHPQHHHHAQQPHGHPHAVQQPDQSLTPNITANPTAESVTVEIIGAEK